jgi:hypothetical protein
VDAANVALLGNVQVETLRPHGSILFVMTRRFSLQDVRRCSVHFSGVAG